MPQQEDPLKDAFVQLGYQERSDLYEGIPPRAKFPDLRGLEFLTEWLQIGGTVPTVSQLALVPAESVPHSTAARQKLGYAIYEKKH